ncbi:hypothetical protein WMY93_014719 [Mugilogobius chulae]|uniref:Lens epithelium-derived growth factor integrase-binding domain-containing protein n=1 Tax=Mugilogobius chulae TaxID=88201 RepID=A0AAW0NZL3_9GOBI
MGKGSREGSKEANKADKKEDLDKECRRERRGDEKKTKDHMIKDKKKSKEGEKGSGRGNEGEVKKRRVKEEIGQAPKDESGRRSRKDKPQEEETKKSSKERSKKEEKKEGKKVSETKEEKTRAKETEVNVVEMESIESLQEKMMRALREEETKTEGSRREEAKAEESAVRSPGGGEGKSLTDSTLHRLHGDIRISLKTDNPDVSACLLALDQLSMVYVTSQHIQRHSELITTLRQLRFYRANEAIMHKASMLYNRFKNAFLLGEGQEVVSADFLRSLLEEKEREEGQRWRETLKTEDLLQEVKRRMEHVHERKETHDTVSVESH